MVGFPYQESTGRPSDRHHPLRKRGPRALALGVDQEVFRGTQSLSTDHVEDPESSQAAENFHGNLKESVHD
jgi:hypothetical protein